MILGFMELLGQLTDSGHPTKEEFLGKKII